MVAGVPEGLPQRSARHTGRTKHQPLSTAASQGRPVQRGLTEQLGERAAQRAGFVVRSLHVSRCVHPNLSGAGAQVASSSSLSLHGSHDMVSRCCGPLIKDRQASVCVRSGLGLCRPRCWTRRWWWWPATRAAAASWSCLAWAPTCATTPCGTAPGEEWAGAVAARCGMWRARPLSRTLRSEAAGLGARAAEESHTHARTLAFPPQTAPGAARGAARHAGPWWCSTTTT